MAQLSRPYQIGLAVIAVLAAAWLLLIHGHGESGQSAPTAAQIASTPAHTPPPAPAKSEGTAGQATGHGSASSLGGLGHAVEKARGAVSTSEHNAKQLGEHSAQASETTTTSTSRPAETTATPAKTKGSNTTSTPAQSAAPKPASPQAAAPKADPSAPSAARRSTASAQQHLVEAQLAKGKVAVILFWDPKGSDDRLVHSYLRSLRGDHSLNIAIDEAAPSQVASFGTITRGVQVYGTPTMLFVNKHGQAVTLTGLQDGYAIAQAVREARRSA